MKSPFAFQFNKGYAALTSTILTLIVSLIIIGGLTLFSFQEVNINRNFIKSSQARYGAEGGIEDSVYRVLTNKKIGSTESLAVGNSTTTTTITTNGTQKIIHTEGKRGTDQQNIELVLQSSTDTNNTSFNYGLQVGYFGMDFSDNSKLIGSVYSNGDISSHSHSTSPQITGDAWVAGGVANSPQQEQSVTTSDLTVTDIASRTDSAQSFVPTITAAPYSVSLYIKKVGSPFNGTIRIVPDNGGKPDDSGSIANGTLDRNTVGTSYAWVTVMLNPITDAILGEGSSYWLIIDNSVVSATDYYVVGGNVDTSYATGTFLYTNNWTVAAAVWSPPPGGAQDSSFRVYMGQPTTTFDLTYATGDVHAHSITNSTIDGSAYYQTISGSTVGGTQNPGSPDPTPQPFPLSQSQITAYETQGDAGGVCGIADGCNVSGDYDLQNSMTGSLGPIKITGDLNIQNTAQLTVTGTIHVVGRIRIENNSVVKLDPSYGATSGVIIADGLVGVHQTPTLEGSGSPGSYLMLMTTNSALTAPSALSLQNAAVGSIFYATRGSVALEGSVNASQITAQKIILTNNAVVTYESGLQNVTFSSGPVGGYTIQSWKEVP